MGGEQTQMAETNEKEINKLFRLMNRYNASDLHLKVDSPPVLRIAGTLRSLELAPLKDDQIRKLVFDILSDEQIETLSTKGGLDFAYNVDDSTRVRVNAFRQRGSISLAARIVKANAPSFGGLHLPTKAMERIAAMESGLVIVAGVTGSGKSTTLASLIERINETRKCHIVTIEDPIEYLYKDKRAFVNQREIGIDCESFEDALKYVVRQDPDVILIGEMRDGEAVAAGLTAAETGHLVFGTLHSSNVAQTFGRILDLFPTERQDQIRQGLQFNLKAIICQKLLPSIKQGVDRVPSVEVMISNPSIRKLIQQRRDGKVADAVRASVQEGMQDFTQSLVQLIQDGYVDKAVAMSVAPNPEQLELNLQGITLDDSKRILAGD